MRSVILLSFLMGGCSYLGAQNVFMELQNFNAEQIEAMDLSMCEVRQGNITADGVYTNGNARVLTKTEMRGGCDGVETANPNTGEILFSVP